MHDATQGFIPIAGEIRDSHDVCVPDRIDCIGHGDLAPWNIVFNGADVAGIIDWDCAGPSSRAWDLSYAAHQFVPLHPTPGLGNWGWQVEPGRAARLRLLASTYGLGITPAEIVDLAVVRLTSTAAYIEREIRAGNPIHRDENHASGYRYAAQFIMDIRDSLLE